MNLRSTRTLTTFSIALALNACTTPAPTYKNTSSSPSDAQISFESDFDLHTRFSVNTERGTHCGKFESVGYLLKANSVFIYDKPNKEIKVKVPVGKAIGVAGYHSFSDPGYKANCYPKGHFFIPEPNGNYVVKMNKISQGVDWKGNEKGLCYISIEEIDSHGDRKKIEYNNPPSCVK